MLNKTITYYTNNNYIMRLINYGSFIDYTLSLLRTPTLARNTKLKVKTTKYFELGTHIFLLYVCTF